MIIIIVKHFDGKKKKKNRSTVIRNNKRNTKERTDNESQRCSANEWNENRLRMTTRTALATTHKELPWCTTRVRCVFVMILRRRRRRSKRSDGKWRGGGVPPLRHADDRGRGRRWRSRYNTVRTATCQQTSYGYDVTFFGSSLSHSANNITVATHIANIAKLIALMGGDSNGPGPDEIDANTSFDYVQGHLHPLEFSKTILKSTNIEKNGATSVCDLRW